MEIKTILTKLHRHTPRHRVFELLNEVAQYNLIDTICCCFYIRDIHTGLGLRDVGRHAIDWIAVYHPRLFIKILFYVPFYGRWDDLLYISNEAVFPLVCQFYAAQLNHDIFSLGTGMPVSLCAKWLPGEGKSFARQYPDRFKMLLQVLGLNPRQYRKRLALLRKPMRLAEGPTCKKQWDQLQYDAYPVMALQRHDATFRAHDLERYAAWKKARPVPQPQQRPTVYDDIPEERYTVLRTILEPYSISV